MKVRLRNPDREVEVPGPKRVREVLGELGINPDTVLVIRATTLVNARTASTTETRSRSGP